MQKLRILLVIISLSIASVTSIYAEDDIDKSGGGDIILFDIADDAASQESTDDLVVEEESVECCKTTFERTKVHVN